MKPNKPRRDEEGCVYVLHIEPPLHHAGHYIGWTKDKNSSRRFIDHLYGRGSPLVAAAVAGGSVVTVELELKGGRYLERKLHNRHGSRVCPRCVVRKQLQPRLTLF